MYVGICSPGLRDSRGIPFLLKSGKNHQGVPPKKSIIPAKLSLPARDEWRSPRAAPTEGKQSPKTCWVLVIPVFTPRIDPTIPIAF